MAHLSVLYHEALDALHIQPNGRYIDGTLGAGGHTRGILERDGHVLAFDRDPHALASARASLADFEDRLSLVQANYAQMAHFAPQHGFAQVDGVLLDLGLSSNQLDDPERGFSFRFDAPLDMRFDPSHPLTAADLLNQSSESTLADLFWRYGDEKYSRRVARAIVAQRPLHTTSELAQLVAEEIPTCRRLHPATKVFQALRIAVNGELEALEQGLPVAVGLLKPAGRLAVISFHSLEDRFVKNYLRDLSQEPSWSVALPVSDWQPMLKRITTKPIGPSVAEVAQNPRSRSAKLRVAEKL